VRGDYEGAGDGGGARVRYRGGVGGRKRRMWGEWIGGVGVSSRV